MKQKQLQYQASINFGYIILPPNVDRSKFIEQCYRWERVSICVERGGAGIHECYVTKSAIRDIEFPLESNQLGSCVAFFTDPFSNHPIIIDVLSKEDESELLGEGIFKIKKNFNGSTVIVSGDSKKGVINISVEGGSVSELNISASNTNKDAKLNLRCQGNIKIEPSGTLKINKGTYPMVRGGSKLKSELDKNNTYLSNLVDAISTALGTLDALTGGASKAAFDATMGTKSPGDYSQINSEESFLD